MKKQCIYELTPKFFPGRKLKVFVSHLITRFAFSMIRNFIHVSLQTTITERITFSYSYFLNSSVIKMNINRRITRIENGCQHIIFGIARRS